MAEDEESKFWRSAKGAVSYLPLLEKHIDELQRKSESNEIFEFTSFDVIALGGLAGNGLVTFITKGLSAFILENFNEGERDVRLELAWTVMRPPILVPYAELLNSIGHLLLSRGIAVYEREIFRSVIRASDFFRTMTVEHMLVLLDHWLLPEESKIHTYFKCYVAELVPITGNELAICENHIEELLRRCETSEIDLMNLSR
jgi:hypothetical protein